MSVADRLQQLILEEFPKTFGTAPDGLAQRIFRVVFSLPTGRFARYFAAADRDVRRAGLSAGCGRMLSDVGISVAARGTENLPTGCPLLVVANHPGAYDSIALGSCIPRGDLKIFLREIPFFRGIPFTSQWFIYATFDRVENMVALRSTIRYLREGGTVLLFGTGTIEPDPEMGSGAVTALGRWSRSVEIIMRTVPGLRLVLAAASGVMMPLFVNHPLRLLRRESEDRRRIAEYMQVITQMLLPRWFGVTVKLSFAPPVVMEELSRESPDGHLMPAIRERERLLLGEHQAAWYG